MTASSNNKANSWAIFIILMLYPLGAMAIDLYLPSLPYMARYFHAPNFTMQMSLTVYSIALGISQLFYGPASDRFGRKRVLLFGIFIFFIASCGLIMVKFSNQLLLLRVFQGIGVGAAFTLASAVLADCFTGNALAQVNTVGSMAYSISPIVAPMIGGYLQHYFGWQSNFVFMSVAALFLLCGIYFFVPETHHETNPRALHPQHFLENYWRLLKNPIFLSNALMLVLAFAIVFTFSVAGPFVFEEALHVSPVHYGQLLVVVGSCYLLACSLNSVLLSYLKLHTLILIGICFWLIFSLGLILSGFLHWFTPTSVTIFSAAVIFSSGFVFPNSLSKALSVAAGQVGTASGLAASLGLFGASALGVFVAAVYPMTAQALGFCFLLQGGLVMVFYILEIYCEHRKKV